MTTAQFLILVMGVLVAEIVYSFPTTLTLERVHKGSVKLDELISRDHMRHYTLSQSSRAVDFSVHGSSNYFTYGCYIASVKLGNPQKEYNLIIDTGSDETWVHCDPCKTCPTTSDYTNLSFFNPHDSTSIAPVFCSDSICESNSQDYGCTSESYCSYSMSYGDGSETSGYFISDSFNFGTNANNSGKAIVSTNMVFGCSNRVSGELSMNGQAFDGLLGFGKDRISIISQLASHGITSRVFSHCLNGEDNGTSILVLGEIVEPGMVYTPLVPEQPRYNLFLTSISIRGKKLPINPEAFSISEHRQGTIIDSGTTLAYLIKEAYDPFISALVAAVPPYIETLSIGEWQCFLVSTSDVFPVLTLNFAGGAPMILKPEEYLIQNLTFVHGAWCLAILKSPDITILGDLVLKDKIVVYDLVRERVGWVDYNCSSKVNVTSTPPGDAGSLSHGAILNWLIPIMTVCWFLVLNLD